MGVHPRNEAWKSLEQRALFFIAGAGELQSAFFHRDIARHQHDTARSGLLVGKGVIVGFEEPVDLARHRQ